MNVFHIQNNMCFYVFTGFRYGKRWLRAIAPMIMIIMMTWMARDEPTKPFNTRVYLSLALSHTHTHNHQSLKLESRA